MKQITIRGVPQEIANALVKEKKRRGTSLNQTILDLLGQHFGISNDSLFDNGLSKLAGTWSKADLREFEKNTSIFNAIDQEVWK
ncbi:MAG: hypothetical protein KIT34_02395 [Cyanobacteria bacterium TGS_CYA1]|nr:hypothetical protein [Cyanobacteria bacterium TGS_CYA1]